MKSTQGSFRFFCYASLFFMATVFSLVQAQTIQDSTRYYYKSITQLNDVTDVSKAFIYLEKKAEKDLASKDTIGSTYCLELISLGQFNLGLFYESESTAIRALKLLDGSKNSEPAVKARKRLLNQLGMLYRRVEDFDNSNRFYEQALSLNTDLLGKISIINNIANNYGDQHQFDNAVDYLDTYYNEVLELPDTLPKATYLDNLGYYQSKIGNSEALSNMELALSIKKNKINHLPSIFSSYRHLSLYFLDRGDLIQAKKYAAMAEHIADSLNVADYQLEALSLKLKLENNPDFDAYLKLQSKIHKTDLAKENKFAAIKYDFQKSELKLKASELETEREETLKLIYLLLAFVILLLSALLYFILRSKHKKDNIQQVFNTETRISKKIHDELANDMSNIMNFVENELKTSDDNKSKLLATLQDVYERTRDISTETSSIDFINFSGSLKYLLIQHNNPNVKIIINDVNTIEWPSISNHKKLAVYRTLQELMVNMKKHSQAHLVTVVFKKLENKNEIWYKDDGRGDSLENIRQSGLSNAESRMKEIGGKLTFETSQGNGFKAIITFKS